MTTRLDANNIAAGSITTNLIANNAVTLDKLPAGMFGPRITGVVLPGGLFAISPAGGETVVINGSGFGPGVQVYFGSLLAPVITRISSTQLNVITPVLNPSTYPLYVTNTDGGTAIRLLAITVSTAPVWATDSVLPTQSQNISIQLSAVSDSSVIYTLASGSSLPPGLSLSTTGLLFGTFIGTAPLSTYNFTVIATDLESQTNSRSFSVSISLADSNFYNVPLLLQTGAASARSTTVVDSSTNNFTVTRNGAPSTGWISPYQTDGYWGNQFNGTTDYLTVGSNSGLAFGTNNFTIEFWAYLNTTSGTQFFYSSQSSGSYTVAPDIYLYNGKLYVQVSSTNPINGTGPTTLVATRWYHIALVKSSGTTTLYVNGTFEASFSDSNTYVIGANRPVIGVYGYNPTVYFLNGYLSNLRVVNGTAIVPPAGGPTSPLTPVPNTSLLTCQSNRFLDTNTQLTPKVITPSGTPRVDPYFYPNGFTSPAASPGAALFNGSTDNLSVASNAAFAFGTSDYTFECWVNSSATAQQVLFTSGGTGTNNFYFSFAPASSYIGVGNQAVFVLQGSNSLSLNVWYHVAASRASGTLKLFLNGVQVASGADGTNWIQGGSTSVGNNSQGSQYFSGYISNLRVVKGTAVYTGNFTPPTTPVTAIANTSLLLNLADSNYTSATNAVQNNTFIDTGPYAFPITRNGTPTQGSVTPYWPNGYWSNYFGGTDYFSGSSASLAFGTGNFTIEAWIYLNSLSATNGAVSTIPSSGGPGVGFSAMTNGKVRASIGNSGAAADFDSSSTLNINTWYHVAFVRSGSNVTVYINGTSVATGTNSSSIVTTGFIVGRGYTNLDVAHFNGYISNARITNTAVYTAAFTPSTTPLTAISGTILLTCQSNRFKDNSASPLTIGGVGGTPKVQAFQPFPPIATYTPAAYGGSGYFPSTNTDYLQFPTSTAFAPGTGDFTLECWVYWVSGTDGFIWTQTVSGTNYFMLTFGSSTANFIATLSGGGTPGISGPANSFFSNVWNHVAVTRSNGTVRVFVNGVSGTPGSNTTDLSNVSYVPTIGRYAHTAAFGIWTGYISNLRYVKGTAVYTANFTPSTTPLTAIPNTSLLTNFTNAAIYDATVQNVITTVGDAKTDTTTKQWSPSSTFLNGSANYLTMPATPQWAMSGDWTLEAWIYPTTVSGVQIIINTRNLSAVTSPVMYLNGSSLVIDTGAAPVISAGTISINSWQYVAATRSGNSWKLFIGGSQVGITTTNTTSYSTAYGCAIGRSSAGENFNGYIQDVRVTKGVARTIGTPGVAFPTR